MSTQSLCVFINRQQIVGPIDLELDEGNFTALIGPQNAGKSTLLRAMNLLIDARAGVRVTGDVFLDGGNIRVLDRKELTLRIGMLFPEPVVFPGTVLENIVYGLRLRGMRDKALWRVSAEKALTEASMWREFKDQLSRPARELSIEQQQRLCVVRILTLRPEVLLLDEPWNAIDIGSRSRLEELVRGLCGRYTILAAMGDMAQAGRLADNVVFMLGGRIIEQGPAEEMFCRPRDKRTGDFITGRFVAG